MQAIQREIKKLIPLTLFFFVGFGYILLLAKLFLKEYAIDTYVLSKAIIGALVAAKAVALMDMTPWVNRFHDYPRYLNVLYQTFLYTLAVLILGAIERIIHAYGETKAINLAIESFLSSEHFSHFLAITLCVSVVFLIHNIFKEIDAFWGKGGLYKFFFERR
jgi:hypothetical protein